MNCNISNKWTKDFDLLSYDEFDELFDHASTCAFHSEVIRKAEQEATAFIKEVTEYGVFDFETTERKELVNRKPSVSYLFWVWKKLNYILIGQNTVSLGYRFSQAIIPIVFIVIGFLVFGRSDFDLKRNGLATTAKTPYETATQYESTRIFTETKEAAIEKSQTVSELKPNAVDNTPSAAIIAETNQNKSKNREIEGSILATNTLIEGIDTKTRVDSDPHFAVKQRTPEYFPTHPLSRRNPLDLLNYQPGFVPGANIGGGKHVHGSNDRAFNFSIDESKIENSLSGISKGAVIGEVDTSETLVSALPKEEGVKTEDKNQTTAGSGMSNGELQDGQNIQINNRNFVTLINLAPSVSNDMTNLNGSLLNKGLLKLDRKNISFSFPDIAKNSSTRCMLLFENNLANKLVVKPNKRGVCNWKVRAVTSFRISIVDNSTNRYVIRKRLNKKIKKRIILSVLEKVE
jgi:hypothetical protein